MLNGAGKGTELVPASGRTVLLFDENFVLRAYQVSDENGEFAFNNLPYGHCKMMVDSWGKYTDTVDVILTPDSTVTVAYIESATNVAGDPSYAALGVSAISVGANPLSVAPNPCAGKAVLSGLAAIDGEKEVQVSDAIGHVIFRTVVPEGRNESTLPAEAWPPGVYSITATSPRFRGSLKMIRR